MLHSPILVRTFLLHPCYLQNTQDVTEKNILKGSLWEAFSNQYQNECSALVGHLPRGCFCEHEEPGTGFWPAEAPVWEAWRHSAGWPRWPLPATAHPRTPLRGSLLCSTLSCASRVSVDSADQQQLHAAHFTNYTRPSRCSWLNNT